MKVYIRMKKEEHLGMIIPHNETIASAMYGFLTLGAEIIPYYRVDEIYEQVTEEDIVVDYLAPCKFIFRKFNIEPVEEDYPECLQEFLGRKIWRDTINSISSNEEKWSAGYFVKPIKEKVFTGKVISSIRDLVGCGNYSENYEVYCSEAVDIKREWRCFIVYDEIIDIRPYKGDYHYSYDAKTVDDMMQEFRTWDNRPKACSIDIGVTSDGKTILIECNDAYALGDYGLENFKYAKLISARWSELFNRTDEYDFRKY